MAHRLQKVRSNARTARQQEALTIRAQGEKQAQIIRADGDAAAAQVYAASFGKDACFYDFYRAMAGLLPHLQPAERWADFRDLVAGQ